MTHPEELLAGYVDGTLTQDERAVVDAHLPGCASCREEVELGREAVAALSALEEVPVPFGVTGPVLAEAGRRFERRNAVWGRQQWAAGLATAAALVLVVALNLGGGDGGEEAAAPAERGGAAMDAQATGAAAAPDAALPDLERQRTVTYTDLGIQALAENPRPPEALAAAEGAEAATGAAGQESASLRLASRDERNDALSCLRDSQAPLDDPRDTLVRLIEALYRDTPAYLAVFLESPGAGQPPDSAVVWVVSTRDCTFLTGASQNL